MGDSRGSRNIPLSRGAVSGPFFSAVAKQGASPGSPGHALHHPLASIQPRPLETRCAPRRAGNRGIECATRPALRCVSGTPSARPPPPPHRRGATAHVSPLAQSGLSPGLPEPEDPERGGGPQPPPPLLASSSAERKLPPPRPRLTWGRGRGFSSPPPLAAFQNLAPQTKFRDPHPAQGPPLCASRVERRQATPPVRSLRGEGEGDLESQPGPSLLKPILMVWGRSVMRPPLVVFFPPSWSSGVILSRVVQASPQERRTVVISSWTGCKPAFLQWGSRNTISCGSLDLRRCLPCSQLPGPALSGSPGSGPGSPEKSGGVAGKTSISYLET
uniref:pistil-specific extensin-like protein n=1 Tax=Arvicanthis niloticus TaxID=61156 RepID=UPI0014860EB8|nr:pistil-specific extensin-like protein [Arvicanthis niloticus]